MLEVIDFHKKMVKLFMLTNFIMPLIEDIVALCFPQLDRKGLMYDPFGGIGMSMYTKFSNYAQF